MERVLEPRGLLLLAFHVGAETVHVPVLWGLPISMDFFQYPIPPRKDGSALREVVGNITVKF
jgi:hypothetical protein